MTGKGAGKAWWTALLLAAVTGALHPQQQTASLEQAARSAGAAKSVFYMEETPEGPRPMERLSWRPAANAASYEAVVERQEEDLYVPVLTERVGSGTTYISCYLPEGGYRMRVRAFDILGRAGPYSDWGYFRALPTPDEDALRIRLHRFSWQPVANAASYEAILEVKSPASPSSPEVYAEVIHTRPLTVTHLDCFLPPGSYRLRVRPLDILGRPGKDSDWAAFEVRDALPDLVVLPADPASGDRSLASEGLPLPAFQLMPELAPPPPDTPVEVVRDENAFTPSLSGGERGVRGAFCGEGVSAGTGSPFLEAVRVSAPPPSLLSPAARTPLPGDAAP